MGLRLLLYLVILVLGGILGYKDKVSEKLNKKLNSIQNLCLLLLLFIMGVKIGIDDKVFSSFFTLGFKALVVSIFTVSFSILGVYIVNKIFFKKEEKNEY